MAQPKVYRSSPPHDRGQSSQLAEETRAEVVPVSPRRLVSMSLFVPLLEFNQFQNVMRFVLELRCFTPFHEPPREKRATRLTEQERRHRPQAARKNWAQHSHSFLYQDIRLVFAWYEIL